VAEEVDLALERQFSKLGVGGGGMSPREQRSGGNDATRVF